MMTEIIKSTPYGLISKHRAELMGVAIIWVLYGHSFLFPSSYLLRSLRVVAYTAVDMFFFISGMSIYRSLTQNTTLDFLRHRFRRLLPVWWFFLVLNLCIGTRYSIQELAGYLTFTGYWMAYKGQGNWFVYAIVLFYILSPVMFGTLKDAKGSVLLLVLTFLLSIPFLGNEYLMRAFCRLPVYTLGMICAAVFDREPIGRQGLIFAVIAFLSGALLIFSIFRCFGDSDALGSSGLFWYPCSLVVPPMTLLFALLLDLKIAQPLIKPLRFLGNASLEILLTSDFLLFSLGIWRDGRTVSFLFLVLVSVTIGEFLHWAVSSVLRYTAKGPRSS